MGKLNGGSGRAAAGTGKDGRAAEAGSIESLATSGNDSLALLARQVRSYASAEAGGKETYLHRWYQAARYRRWPWPDERPAWPARHGRPTRRLSWGWSRGPRGHLPKERQQR